MRKNQEFDDEDDDGYFCDSKLLVAGRNLNLQKKMMKMVITKRRDENIEIELKYDDRIVASGHDHHSSNQMKKQHRKQPQPQSEPFFSLSLSSSSNDRMKDLTILDILSEDVIGYILECLGPGEFRYFAGTCTTFAHVYRRMYGNRSNNIKNKSKNKNKKSSATTTTYKTYMRNVVESVSRSQLYLIEEGNCSKNLQHIAYHSSLYGNLHVLENVMSQNASDNIDVDSSNDDTNATTLWNNRYAVESIRTNAAKGGHLHILKFSQDKTIYPFRKQVLHCAILLGNLDVVQWLLESGSCPHDNNTCNYAVRTDNNIDILKCLRRHGLPWDEFTFMYAAAYGSLDILQYLHKQECPWDIMVCYQASKHGHLKVLQWARQHNCPWNQQLNRRAAEQSGHSDIVRWIDDTYSN